MVTQRFNVVERQDIGKLAAQAHQLKMQRFFELFGAAMAVSAAITTMLADYLPLARQANNQAFIPPRGLPAWPYNVDYGRNQDKF